MLAVVGFEVGLFVATWTASIFSLALGSVYHGGRHDTCGDSDDGITQNHDDAGKEASYEGDRCDVAISNGGHRDDSPIDAGAQIRELCARLTSLNHEHECAQNGDEDEDEEEIDEYLAPYGDILYGCWTDEQKNQLIAECIFETDYVMSND